MNCILFNDESSIDDISDGDYIIIIENIYYLDDTYLNSLININFNGTKINVGIWKNGTELFLNLVVSPDIKLSQLYKALILHMAWHHIFKYKNESINTNDDRLVENGMRNCILWIWSFC